MPICVHLCYSCDSMEGSFDHVLRSVEIFKLMLDAFRIDDRIAL